MVSDVHSSICRVTVQVPTTSFTMNAILSYIQVTSKTTRYLGLIFKIPVLMAYIATFHFYRRNQL
jgi:hypothetical protein